MIPASLPPESVNNEVLTCEVKRAPSLQRPDITPDQVPSFRTRANTSDACSRDSQKLRADRPKISDASVYPQSRIKASFT
ncbi:MAG: hypothetical protein BWX80_02925 [Candidatus Hydrogenedentes bacterium ADurb.Bin101]|nr:MAG: hypothetical protein BWX80_02925 [Candidatus Hydrogenedentes bacterium ADurb.Bin101]